jgi:putative PIN family toxin of toxin-antitoxin system
VLGLERGKTVVKRVVVDTNVFVASAYQARSASRTIVEKCRSGELTLIVSPAVRREYEQVLPRAIRSPDETARIEGVLEGAKEVQPLETPAVVVDDPSDDKFFAAAAAGNVEALISSDRRVLAVGEYRGVRVLTPARFLASLP